MSEASDRIAVQDVMLRYAAGVDERDFDLYRSCFADDVDVVGFGKETISGADAWLDYVRRALERYGATQHMLGPQLATLDGDTASVTREVDIGMETINVDLPAVITVDLRLNEPRYVKLPDIMKAKKKPLDEIPLEELGIEAVPQITHTAYAPPAEREKGIMVEDVAGLVAALKDKGLV